MDYKEILEQEINKLNKVIAQLGGLNVIDYKTGLVRKDFRIEMQKRINEGYSLIFDVKMDLEKIVKEMEK